MTVQWTGLKSFKHKDIVARLNNIANTVGNEILGYSLDKVKQAYINLGKKLPGYYLPEDTDIRKALKEQVATMATHTASELLKSIIVSSKPLMFYIPGDPLDKGSPAFSARVYNLWVKDNEVPFSIIIELKTQWKSIIKSLFGNAILIK